MTIPTPSSSATLSYEVAEETKHKNILPHDVVEKDLEKQEDENPESIINGSSQEESGVRSDGSIGSVQHDVHSADHDEDGEDERSNPSNGGSGIVSRITSRSGVAPEPPPDGGLQAWTVVFCGHLNIMVTWGIIISFGVFQTYYATLLPSRSPSDISWIGSVQVFLTFFVGTLSGRLVDAGFFRPVFLAGGLLLLLGTFSTSWATQYWQFLLAQGICLGLGQGCLFCPTLALVSTYFSSKRSLALGLIACGSATGGLVFPAMVRQLLPQVGLPWTMRAMGFIQLLCLVVSLVSMRPRIRPRRNGRWVEWGAFKEVHYTFYAVGTFFCFWGVYFAFYYLSSFATDVLDPPFSYADSLNLLLILNGVGIIGRTLPNHVADKIGPLNMFVPFAFISGLLSLCWIAVTSAAGLYVWATINGIVASGLQSLFAAALSSLTDDPRKMGVRMGMIFTIVSFSVLTGAPIQGAIITAQGGSYVGAQAFAGVSLLIGSGFLAASRIARSRSRGKGWRDMV
ncbi:3-oxoacyl-[acyl-carrier-protein] reductase [Zalerion maritima]|uniref:3-oxoacyl-[acyl-carrier-protein] reductase n=1 Tax=Zalerion maritima TaxID=339359 RepID=A0AAD5RR13_9PEZI|nr:3-oxoacyl-[acyl-carrier-protein] reductase [Zalerion maritima]